MKKVRLFAIAASFGMLAATVNAAEVVKYNTTWTNVPEGEVIRAEFGGNIVAPALGAEVTKFVQSTTGDAKKVCVKPDGTTALDSNLDGVADQIFYTWSGDTTNSFWYFSDAKFVPTPTTFKYYGAMTKNAPGGRILAPGQAAQNGIVNGATHAFVSFNDTAAIDALLADALKNGGATVSEDEDGYVTYHLGASDTGTKNEYFDSTDDKTTGAVQYHPEVYWDAASKSYKIDYQTLVKYVATGSDIVVDAADYGSRVARANDDARTEVLRYITGLNTEGAVRKQVTYSYFNVDHNKMLAGVTASFDDKTPKARNYNVMIDEDNVAKPAYGGSVATSGDVKFNVYGINRYGALIPYEVVNKKTVADFLEGTSIKQDKMVDGVLVKGTDLKSSVILINDTRGLSTTTATKINSLDDLDITIINFGTDRSNVRAYDRIWDSEAEEFVKVTRPGTEVVQGGANFSIEETNRLIDIYGGYYTVDTPANTSDKYVVDYALGAYNFDNKLNGTLSRAKMKLTYTSVPTNDVGVRASSANPYVVDVLDFSNRYDNIFLPAFATEEDAVKYINAMSGLKIADSAYVKSLEKYAIAAKQLNKSKSAITRADMPVSVKLADGRYVGFKYGSFKVALDHDRTFLDGTKLAYVPTNILDHTTSTQCVYTDAGTKVEAGDFTVTNNLAEINAQSYGVKELKYTAKVGETVVGEKTIKVVVAPKYERTWVGGRVSTLKAFHLNGAAYALYQYNYTTKTVKVTFYELDGVTVSSTAEFPL